MTDDPEVLHRPRSSVWPDVDAKRPGIGIGNEIGLSPLAVEQHHEEEDVLRDHMMNGDRGHQRVEIEPQLVQVTRALHPEIEWARDLRQ